jgi:hypothetical protein
VLGIRRRDAEGDQTVADELGAREKQIFAYRRRRLTLEEFERLLLVVTLVVGALVGIYAVLPEASRKSGSATVEPTLDTPSQRAAETSVSVAKSSDPARKQSDDLRSKLAQATEQLKSSQGRVSQLEAQLKQVPSSADLDNARKQSDDLRSQLAQATEQLKSPQGRVSQLEAQLKQVPSSADLDNARKQSDDLRSQLSTAMAIAEKPKKVETTALKSTPTPTSATTAAVARAGDETEAFEHPEVTTKGQPLDSEGNKGLTAPTSSGSLALAAVPAAVLPEPARPLSERSPPSADTSMLLARGDSLLGVGDIASARLFYERAADIGDGQAALRLGETYDPAFLERARLRVQGDRARAVLWYQRARELGASEAEILLKGAQVR